ncbi:hypothetical protein HYT54_05465 [Candidatus Woesearchaeota archaeon]|nr:hypothetical protein [Candidatus Woesearchaeota archaeon]
MPNQPAVSPASRPASVCAADVQQCNDGTYVSRDPANNCNFRACPVQILGPDFDNNGCVESVNDFQSFANAFKAKRLAVDYSGDGKIDMDDFFRFADRIGSSQNQQACSRLMTAALS